MAVRSYLLKNNLLKIKLFKENCFKSRKKQQFHLIQCRQIDQRKNKNKNFFSRRKKEMFISYLLQPTVENVY